MINKTNMRYLILTIFSLATLFSYSQSNGGFGNSNNWSLNKSEIFFSVGATQFLGDLGGLNREGTQNSIADLDWSSTRYGAGFGYRFRFHPRFATSTQLYAGMLSGNDANTDEIIRRSRNLSFRSIVVELSQRLEYIIYAKEEGGARYNSYGTKGRGTKADIFYVFSGVSGFFFNPQTKINGSWTDLRPLRTEGQGLPNGAEEYKRTSLSIPFGVGFKFAIGKYWRLGIEVSYNKTFTDYIDDVSTVYYDPETLQDKVGGNAVYAANPSIENHTWFTEGQQRGNPEDNDAYMFSNITIIRNITYPKPKGMSRTRWNGRTKF
ncbi:hypothetical protein DXU93_14295 [Brumimicrobium aurantiacum]|uniref:DUF6089 domain-containing protein n=2 Tax=Brumimicrobium aurantiacum TaxID=1737063 RepID=A0A3E1EUJ5_9FLAO|nr:hypothetical protein DXU93_14295 [Brumimicrobium aurantiacum]